MYDGIVQDLIDEFGRLPGIGPKSAQRITFHILQSPSFDVSRLSKLLGEVRETSFTRLSFDAAVTPQGVRAVGLGELSRV